MGETTNTARDQGKEEASHWTAASPENNGLHKMVSKDPCGSDKQKCQKRAGVGMEVTWRTWARPQKICRAEKWAFQAGGVARGMVQRRSPHSSSVNVRMVSSSLPMTLPLGQDQHALYYVMNTDTNCYLKGWLKMICSNDEQIFAQLIHSLKCMGQLLFPTQMQQKDMLVIFSGREKAHANTSGNSYREHFHLRGLLEGKLNSGGNLYHLNLAPQNTQNKSL